MVDESTKSYLPRSLYGRAALILLVPLIALQLLVSVVFIQRHYEGVTQQMTRNVVLDLRLVLELIAAAPDARGAQQASRGVAEALRLDLEFGAELPGRDHSNFYDLSAREMIATMRLELPEAQRFDTTINRQVRVWMQTPHGVVSAVFDRRRVSASNPHQLLVLMVFAGLALAFIAFVFMRNQLRPIRRLARASEAFGRGQRLSFRPYGATEIQAAGQAFLDMRDRIERQIEQRTMMLSGVSHDLRTPLTRLKLGLSLLDQEPEAEAMLRDVDDMERLVDEFLDFARQEALDAPKPVQAAALAESVVAKFRGAGHDISYSAEADRRVTLHPMALERALSNLIGNAVKYGAAVSVHVSFAGRAVTYTVEDDGPGIAKHLRQDALKPFVRLDPSRNQDRGSGVGLGLAIAHDIARRHGGRLELDKSPNLGGLRATLVLAG